MKYLKSLVLLTIPLLSMNTIAQTGIDDMVTVDFPGEMVMDLDTVVNGIRLRQLMSQKDGNGFVLQRIKAGSKDALIKPLPHDYSSLNEYYDEVLAGLKTSLNEQGYGLLKKSEIKVDNYIGRQVDYGNLDTKEVNISTKMFLLEEHLYTVQQISSFEKLNKSIGAKYFGSINVNNELKPQQMAGKSPQYLSGYLLGKILIWGSIIAVGIFAVRTLIKER